MLGAVMRTLKAIVHGQQSTYPLCHSFQKEENEYQQRELGGSERRILRQLGDIFVHSPFNWNSDHAG